jgi:hypothetical protein
VNLRKRWEPDGGDGLAPLFWDAASILEPSALGLRIMDSNVNKRIEAIRAKARDERALLAETSATISSELKKELGTARSQLEFVEGYFLEPKILREPRTSAQWRYWLNGADQALKIAIQERKRVQALIKVFGPDVRRFGG